MDQFKKQQQFQTHQNRQTVKWQLFVSSDRCIQQDRVLLFPRTVGRQYTTVVFDFGNHHVTKSIVQSFLLQFDTMLNYSIYFLDLFYCVVSTKLWNRLLTKTQQQQVKPPTKNEKLRRINIVLQEICNVSVYNRLQLRHQKRQQILNNRWKSRKRMRTNSFIIRWNVMHQCPLVVVLLFGFCITSLTVLTSGIPDNGNATTFLGKSFSSLISETIQSFSSSSSTSFQTSTKESTTSSKTPLSSTSTNSKTTNQGSTSNKKQQDKTVQMVVTNLPEYGNVLGRREQGIDFYGGIPYAAPPVGPLRWAPPEPATPWSPAQLDATQFGPDCWQSYDPILNPNADPRRMSEDCLYLNVYTPAGASRSASGAFATKLPVMVWLHGGAFRQGGARRPEYDGRRLAERGTVVVTINYRLGALGFLVSSIDGLYGNFGLMDQRAALHWVKDNIQYFGGDPNNITVFGESAGAVMAVLHLLMEKSNNPTESHSKPKKKTKKNKPARTTTTTSVDDHADEVGSNNSHRRQSNRRTTTSRGNRKRRLFHKAIIQSNPLGLQFRSVVVADFIGDALKRSVDCRDLQCLRAERVEDIMKAQSSLMGIPRSVGDFFTWGPTLTNELKVTIGATNQQQSSSTPSSSTIGSSSSSRQGTADNGQKATTYFGPNLFTLSREENRMFRDLDLSTWKWQSSKRDNYEWVHVNVTQPLRDYDLIPDDIPIILGVNKHEGEMFVHSAFPITMSKVVYWMFVGALFRGSASRVLQHYRGYVDQIEKEAADIAQKQIYEEECRQFYIENQHMLDKEYQYLVQLNASRAIEHENRQNAINSKNNGNTTIMSGYEALFQTWGRGGASSYTSNDADISSSTDSVANDENKHGNQCLWYEKIWPFRIDKMSDSRAEYEEQRKLRMIEKRRLKEIRRKVRAKERALQDAAKVVVDYRPVMSRIVDDYLFRCPTWNLAHKLSRQRADRSSTSRKKTKGNRRSSSNANVGGGTTTNNNNNVFVYQFSHSTHVPGFKECWGKACHTSELPFVFEAMEIIRTNYSTLGPYAQVEAPESPEYPYTDILAAYRDAMEAEDRLNNRLSSSSTTTANEDDIDENDRFADDNYDAIDEETISVGQQQQRQEHLNRGFQRLLNHFFGDYFKEDADEEIASDMADRWVSFARNGDPNYEGSKADWRPWRKIFDDDFENDDDDKKYFRYSNEFPYDVDDDDDVYEFDDMDPIKPASYNTGRNNRQNMWLPEEFDEIFDLDSIIETIGGETNLNNTNIEGDYWFENPEERMYRRRALIALGMEVVEEDVFKTLLRRTKYKEESDNPFYAFLQRLGGSTQTKSGQIGGKEKRMRRAIRQLQLIAQDMGFIGTGIQGEPRRGNVIDNIDDSFFPEVMELKWPPEGRLVERDCTCDMWDRIGYRY